MKWAWARWVLFGLNVLAAVAGVLVWLLAAVMAFGEGLGLGGVLQSMVVCAIPPIVFSALAHQQRHRRGVLFQTVVALVALFSALVFKTIFPAIYGGYALLAVWVLGDFRQPVAPRAPPTGSPEVVAHAMFKRGESIEKIRAVLAARKMPAPEIETLVYALARSRHD